MKILRWLSLSLGGVLLLQACSPKPSPSLIEKVLSDASPNGKHIWEKPETYIPQIIFTQIDRDSNNTPHFTSHYFRTDDSTYFYPASTVKMPVAFLAFEKVHQLGLADLDVFTPMLTDSAFSGQSAVYVDSSSQSGLPSIAHYAKKIFIVSDNDAFNRLYEFVGQAAINNRLHAMGYTKARIMHRLSIFLSEAENSHTNPIRFVKDDQLIYHQKMQVSEQHFGHPKPILMGEGELIGDAVRREPKDFAKKNFVPLADLHDMLKAILFPYSVPAQQRFDISEEAYPLLYQYMSELPQESKFPSYDPQDKYDSYVKFFLFGDSESPIPKHIRIFNKVGYAYGFLTDVAYIVDFEAKVEFMLAATVHVNKNQVYNDGKYEYDEIGIPYLAEIGRAFYQYELAREKKYLPDLSQFQLSYE